VVGTVRLRAPSVVVLSAFLALGACDEEKKPPAAKGSAGARSGGPRASFHKPAVAALRKAGLEAGDFTNADGAPYGAERCVKGKVGKLELLVCTFADAAAATAGEKRLEAFAEGAVTGAVKTFKKLGFSIVDRQGVDLQGKTINKILQALPSPEPEG